MDKIEIPLSKKKILLGIGGSLLFVVLGVYVFTIIVEQQTRYPSTPVKASAIAAILFFGATGIYGIKKYFDKGVGLTIDENGIIDNTNALGTVPIKWTDITEIRTGQVMSTKFLLIFIKDPNRILEKTSGIKRKLMLANMRMYGTPLSITSATLKYSFNDLEKLLNDKLSEQREKILLHDTP